MINKDQTAFIKKRYIFYFFTFILITFLTLLYIYNIFEETTKVFIFKYLPISSLIILITLLFLYFISDALRLYFVLKILECKVDFLVILRLVFIKIFISNITPFAAGGGFIQVYFLNKNDISLGDAVAATTIRTVLATTIIFIVAPVSIFTVKNIEAFLPFNFFITYLLFFVFIFIFLFYIIIFKKKLIKILSYKILKYLKNKNLISIKNYKKILKYLLKEIDIFSKGIRKFLSGNKFYSFLSIIITIIFLIIEFSFIIVLIKFLGYKINYLMIYLRQTVIMFFMYFAPTPGAAGIAEGGFSLAFRNIVNKEDIFSLIFAWRFLTKYIGMIIGFSLFMKFIFWRKKSNEEKNSDVH